MFGESVGLRSMVLEVESQSQSAVTFGYDMRERSREPEFSNLFGFGCNKLKQQQKRKKNLM